MITILLILVCVALYWLIFKITDLVKALEKFVDNLPKQEEPKETEAFVTRTAPLFTNENKVGQEESSIVVPKSPQLIAWEEEEELRKLNLMKVK